MSDPVADDSAAGQEPDDQLWARASRVAGALLPTADPGCVDPAVVQYTIDTGTRDGASTLSLDWARWGAILRSWSAQAYHLAIHLCSCITVCKSNKFLGSVQGRCAL